MKFIIFAFMSFCCLSCYKTKLEEKEDNTSKNTALLKGSWKLIAVASAQPFDWDGNGTIETDYFSVLDSCEKDKLLVFDSNPVGFHKLACNESRNFNWELKEKGSYIEVYYPPIGPSLWYGYAYWTIFSISDSFLKLKWNHNSPVNTLTTIEVTYKKQ